MSERRRTNVLRSAVAITALAAGVALAATWRGHPDRALLLWTALCVIGEALWVRLPLGDATISMAITFNFAAMLLLSSGHALAAIACSTLIGEAAFMRKSPLRIVFNAAQSVLSAGAGLLVWNALGGYLGAGAPDAGTWLACAGAAVAYVAVNTLAVSTMVTLERGLNPWRVWRANFGRSFELLSNGALFSMGVLLAMVAGRLGGEVVALFALPLLVVWISSRHALVTAGRAEVREEESREAA